MFFKSKKPEVPKEDSRIQDLQIITQMNQEFATSLDLNETLQNSLEVIIYSPNFYLHLHDAVIFIQYCIDGILEVATQLKI